MTSMTGVADREHGHTRITEPTIGPLAGHRWF